MEKITYPDGEEISYGYDYGGNVESVKGKNRNVGFTYVNKAGYDEFGQRAYLKLGNGVETRYEYDENRRWLQEIRTVRENTVLQGITYSFDAVGNVLGYANKAGGYETEQKYTYDGLYQLTGADGESKSERYGMLEYLSMYSQEYQFDNEGLGNMTLKRSETANTQQRLLGDPLDYRLEYEYEPGYAHRAKKIGTKYYKYNLNGSVTGVQERPFEAETAHGKAVVNDLGGGAYSTEGGWALNEPKAGGTSSSSTQPLREYRWDERNRLAYSNDERYGVRYAYGEDGQRTGKWATSHAGGESETLYFGKLWSWHYDGMAGDYTGMNSSHVFLGDTRIATKAAYADGSFIEHAQKERQYYYHSDHLGSAQLITDYKGDEYERVEYTPYGELWIEKAAAASALDVAYRFTGKELDKETGLYYYGARYLDPRDSRWLSVDPAMGEYVPAPEQEIGKLPGMGGVFNTVNLHVYHYAGNNPVKYTDPDGRELNVSGDETQKTQILDWINSLSEQQYIIKDGVIIKDGNKKNEYGSKQYSDAINSLIDNGTTTIKISNTYTTVTGDQKPLPLDKNGNVQGGYTHGSNAEKIMNVTVRGVAMEFDTNAGKGVRSPGEILIHELACHAAPRISGNIGNAVDIENSIMVELFNKDPMRVRGVNEYQIMKWLRAPEKDHSTHPQSRR